MAGTMTMASALPGGIARASRLTDTVGRPSPITPLMNPASRKMAAMTTRNMVMGRQLTEERRRHNVEVTEPAFGVTEGRKRAGGQDAFRPGRPAALHCGRRQPQHHARRRQEPPGARLR